MRPSKTSSGCENYLKTKVTLSDELCTTLIANIPNGFAYCKIITNETGKPIDYIGKRATEVFSGTADNPADWIDINLIDALTQKPVTTEKYLQITEKWYQYSVYSLKQGYFISIFEDITEHKKTVQDNESLKMALEQCAEQMEEIVEEMAQARVKQLKEVEWRDAVDQIAGLLGRDIHNPLQSIVGEVYLASNDLQFLPESPAKKNISESLELIRKNSEFVYKIVSDLQDCARLLKPEYQRCQR